jgi:hypothetical protein
MNPTRATKEEDKKIAFSSFFRHMFYRIENYFIFEQVLKNFFSSLTE